MACKANITAYESSLEALLTKHPGEYALMYSGAVRGVYPSRDKALEAGREAERPFAVIKIVADRDATVDWGVQWQPSSQAA